MNYGAIIVSNASLAARLQPLFPGRVTVVPPQFLEVYPPPLDQEEPVIKIRLPKYVQQLQQTPGPWLCVLPPSPFHHQALLLFALLHLAPGQVHLALAEDLSADGLRQLPVRAKPPDPWYVATLVLQRLASNYFRQQWYGWLENQELPWVDWLTLMHLLLWEELHRVRWVRQLRLGDARAFEINQDGCWIWWNRPPRLLNVSFIVQDKQTTTTYPDHRLWLTHLLLQTNPCQALEIWLPQLEKDYQEGRITHPWVQGVVDYQQTPMDILHTTAWLAAQPSPQAVQRHVRIYHSPHLCFKATAFQDDQGQPLTPPLPSSENEVIQEVECLTPQDPWTSYLQTLYRWQINVELPRLQRLVDLGLLSKQPNQLSLTPQGLAMVHACWKCGMTLGKLRDCLKLLESVYLDEIHYITAWTRLRSLLQWQVHE